MFTYIIQKKNILFLLPKLNLGRRIYDFNNIYPYYQLVDGMAGVLFRSFLQK